MSEIMNALDEEFAVIKSRKENMQVEKESKRKAENRTDETVIN